MSLQEGDTIWYVPTTEKGGYSVSHKSNIQKLGRVEFISNQYRSDTIKVSVFPTDQDPNLSNWLAGINAINYDPFFMFSKNNNFNVGGLNGYYAEIKFVNNSKRKAELYAVSSEVFESSK